MQLLANESSEMRNIEVTCPTKPSLIIPENNKTGFYREGHTFIVSSAPLKNSHKLGIYNFKY